jgi:hypothetical protein
MTRRFIAGLDHDLGEAQGSVQIPIQEGVTLVVGDIKVTLTRAEDGKAILVLTGPLTAIDVVAQEDPQPHNQASALDVPLPGNRPTGHEQWRVLPRSAASQST